MIDLLLGALGGVALLVILFFAMQKINAKQNPTTAKKYLYVEIVSVPEGWEIGDEIGLVLKDSDSEKCFLELGQTIASGNLKTTWYDEKVGTAKRPFFVSVAFDPNTNLSLGVWARSIYTEDSHVSEYLEKLFEFRNSAQGSQFIIRAYWSDLGEQNATYFNLTAANGFFEIKVVR